MQRKKQKRQSFITKAKGKNFFSQKKSSAPYIQQKKTNATAQYTENMALKQAIIELLSSANKPLQLDSITRALEKDFSSKKNIDQVLKTLEEEYILIKNKGAWITTKQLLRCVAELHINASGHFYLRSADFPQTIEVQARHLADALPGDKVQAILYPFKEGNKLVAKIEKVLEEKQGELLVLGQQKLSKGLWLCTLTHKNFPAAFLLEAKDLNHDIKESLLLVERHEMIQERLWKVSLKKNFSTERDASNQELITRINHGIPLAFSEDILAFCKNFPEHPSEKDWEARKDLRNLDFVTIDGESAKDFDDAICVHKHKDAYTLFVAIADVAHYVQEASILDKEAQERSNSYYFPLSVTPMLPPILSDQLCSLQEKVPRLALVAEMRCSLQGTIQSASFYEAVIQSKARLTYDLFKSAIIDKTTSLSAYPSSITAMLEDALALAHLFAKQRELRGTLEFNLPQAVFSFTEQNEISGIFPFQTHFGHKVIEEFMISANECAAHFFKQHALPALYRIHPEPSPEKLEQLFSQLKNYSEYPSIQAFLLQQKKKNDLENTKSILHYLQAIMEETASSPQGPVIHRTILRSMMQAKYSPENEGHFGLASEEYCHFTSPIRRYADLLIHRQLKKKLRELNTHSTSSDHSSSESASSNHNFSGSTFSAYADLPFLEQLANKINERERAAVLAEREIHKRLALLLLEKNKHDCISGTISGLTDFGIFVELDTYLVEGLLPLSSLQDDYYTYYQDKQYIIGKRKGKRFSLGQRIKCTIKQSSFESLEITLAPLCVENEKKKFAFKKMKKQARTKKR